MTHDELLKLPARRLRALIGARRLSPVELMDACISRIEAINPAVNAIAATDFERARASGKPAIIELRLDRAMLTTNATVEQVRAAGMARKG